MAAERGEFIVIRTLDPVETGQELRSIPPHMTELSWFFVQNNDLERLIPQIDELADRHGFLASTAEGKRRVLYGENEDIPACEMTVAHDKIHQGLVAAVKALDGTYRFPNFALNWSPHITDEHGVSIQVGQRVKFSSLALISRQDDESGKRKLVEHSAQLLGGVIGETTSRR